MRVSIVGGSGYTGGELLRLLLSHPEVQVAQVTSESNAGKYVYALHPNLRQRTRMQFMAMSELEPCDLLFLCLPHGESIKVIDRFRSLAPRLIDLSADLRLAHPEDYLRWYGYTHPRPELLAERVYGLPELHREQLRTAKLVSGAGCNATATILALYPLFASSLVDVDQGVVVEVKVGSSEGGSYFNLASHHPERSGAVRSFAPTGHRHTAEIAQELTFHGQVPRIFFSATAVELVRGILATCHVFLKDDLEEKDIWRIYRQFYSPEPFIRIVKDKAGVYRYPEPKILAGSNFCDVGFEKEADSRRLVVMAALDNLMKGAAGNAVQVMNVMCGWPETTGLEFTGLHPI